MAMNFSLLPLINSSIAILIALIFLLSPSFCLIHQSLPVTFRGLLMEEKQRLGSTPPSCHNKCNQCHPCLAVQAPTLPSHSRVDPSQAQSKRPAYYFDSSGNRYSNYKPLGWKCRCGGHFFNP